MELLARHHDGFTEHLVSWALVASNGSGIIEASWLSGFKRVERMFEMEFPPSRIQTVFDALVGLKPIYDGHFDDLPQYHLCVTDGSLKLSTKVLAGFKWPSEDAPAVDAFMSVWRPLSRDVERILAIPGRDRTRR